MLYIVETAKDAETAVRDLEEAAKRNMRFWIQDESNYPSGFAGGTAWIATNPNDDQAAPGRAPPLT